MKKISYILLIALLLAACTEEPEYSKYNTARDNVEALWNIIDKKYCFVEEKNVDWNTLHDEYLGYADTVKTDRQLFTVMADMLDHLQDGHVNLYSEFDVSRCRSWYEGYPVNYSESLLYSERYLGKDYKIAGGIHYDTIAGGKVGLIHYSSFSSGVGVMNMAWVLGYFQYCDGIIIDMRNNGGGSLEYARSFASSFFSEPRQVGWWSHKTGEGHFDMSELEPMTIDTTQYKLTRWTKPVVVLCNRKSYSATNFFISAMRYADNCLIIGGKTGGGGGMPLSYELPCGWMVRFSSVKMCDLEKNSIEDGINPNKEVTLKSDKYDDIIEAAISAIDNDLRL